MFIIAGIILLMIVGTYLALQVGKAEILEREEIEEVPIEVQPIKDYVEHCIAQVGEDAVYLVGLQGGYYEIYGESIGLSGYSVPIYFYLNKTVIPTLEDIEKEVDRYIEDNIDGCLDNFSMFKNQGFDIEVSTKKSNSSIIGTKIYFDLYHPLEISKENFKSNINKFSYMLNFDFLSVHNIIMDVAEEQKKISGYIPIGA